MKVPTVKGLPVPKLLAELIEKNKWVNPGDDIIKTAIPFLKEPLTFLPTYKAMEFESQCIGNGVDHMFEASGKFNPKANELPWIDCDLSFFIAVNKNIGDDIGIALDFRISIENPRVVANNWHTGTLGCPYEVISNSFDEFVKMIGINYFN